MVQIKLEEDLTMLVGVPKEIKVAEARVGLTPGAVGEYVGRGHRVVVETRAGAGIGADDAAYVAAGAEIAKDAAEVFAKADMIVKVKEPQPQEWVQLRAGQILFTYLHLAADPAQARGLMASGVTAIAYETVTDAAGGLPLLAPMSEVAGRLSIQAAATACNSRMAVAASSSAACRACLPARSSSSAAASSALMRRGSPSVSAPRSRSSIGPCRASASSTRSSPAASAPASPPGRR
jgi:alanine dehydrogenase